MKTSGLVDSVVNLLPDGGDIFDEPGYTLKIGIKRGNIVGGGLPNGMHVITSIGDEIVNKTADVQAPYYFNETITKVFDVLEPVVPVIISFSMYKKRWTSPGYKLVGTIQFPLSDLRGILNKAPVEKQFNVLSNRRNITLHGSLILSLSLTENETKEGNNSNSTISAQKRDLSAASVFGRMGDALSQRNWSCCLMLCALDDISALLKLALEYENVILGNTVNLVAALVVLMFLAFNYFTWTQAEGKLSGLEDDLHSIQRLLGQ